MGKYDGAMVSQVTSSHVISVNIVVMQDIYMESRFLYDKASQPINVARAECAVAHIHHLRGAYKQAERLFNDALERFKKEKGKSDFDCLATYVSTSNLGEDDLDVASTLHLLGELMIDCNSFTEAEVRCFCSC